MQAQDRALSRVPIEIWHDIFEFVTSVPRKYEFTLDGAAYVMMNEASRAEIGIPTPKEAEEITRFLYSIVHVCKHWYAIGIKALWSHLRINIFGDAIRAIEGIQEAIRRDTFLAAQVMGVDKDYGSVAVGKYADLIVVHGDPLQHMNILRDPVIVIKHGHRYK